MLSVCIASCRAVTPSECTCLSAPASLWSFCLSEDARTQILIRLQMSLTLANLTSLLPKIVFCHGVLAEVWNLPFFLSPATPFYLVTNTNHPFSGCSCQNHNSNIYIGVGVLLKVLVRRWNTIQEVLFK